MVRGAELNYRFHAARLTVLTRDKFYEAFQKKNVKRKLLKNGKIGSTVIIEVKIPR